MLNAFFLQIQRQLDDGSSPIPSDYAGPRLPASGQINEAFIDELIEWFRGRDLTKGGNVLPKRIAWEIILGAYGHMREESSLVDVPIPKGQTVNVMCVSFPSTPLVFRLALLRLADYIPPFHPFSTQRASRSGDTHGQLYDFINLLSLTGKPSPTHTLGPFPSPPPLHLLPLSPRVKADAGTLGR